MSREAAESERLTPEVQISGSPPMAGDALPSSQAVVPQDTRTLDDVLMNVMQAPELQGLFQRLLNGAEPYSRPLARNEPLKFNPTNISVVLLRAAGLKGKEIADIVGQTQAYVSITLRHPYGQKLLSVLLPMMAAQSLDIKRRAEAYASTMLDKLFDMGLESDDIVAVKGITFGLMDRAGYGAVQRSEVKHSFNASDASINRMAEALHESSRVDEAYADYTIVSDSDEGSAAQDGTSADLASDELARNPNEPPGGGSLAESQQEAA